MILTRKMTLLLLATAADDSKFTIYNDGRCELTPSGDLRVMVMNVLTPLLNPDNSFSIV